jgi:hypothetical protein
MRKLSYLVCIGTAVAFVSCNPTKEETEFQPYPAPNKDGIIIVEAEKMELKGCEIVDVEGDSISGGKAVKVLDTTSTAEFKIKVKAGTYLANAYVNAPDATHDGFWLVANNLPPSRSFPNKHGIWRYLVRTLTFTIEQDGEHVIKFTPQLSGQAIGDSGFMVDRIEIINTLPADLAGARQKIWTNPNNP